MLESKLALMCLEVPESNEALLGGGGGGGLIIPYP